jgi:histone H3/H4
MEDEAKKLIPKGVIVRIVKPSLVAKECRMSPEYIAALNKYVSQLMVSYTEQACEITLARNKKTLSVDDLKAVGEKNGFMVE